MSSKKFDLAGFGRKIARYTVDQCSEMRKELRANNRTGVLSDDDYDAADDLLLDRRDAATQEAAKRSSGEPKPTTIAPVHRSWISKKGEVMANDLIEIQGEGAGWSGHAKGPRLWATVLDGIDQLCLALAAFDYEVDIESITNKLAAVDLAKVPSITEQDHTEKKSKKK